METFPVFVWIQLPKGTREVTFRHFLLLPALLGGASLDIVLVGVIVLKMRDPSFVTGQMRELSKLPVYESRLQSCYRYCSRRSPLWSSLTWK